MIECLFIDEKVDYENLINFYKNESGILKKF